MGSSEKIVECAYVVSLSEKDVWWPDKEGERERKTDRWIDLGNECEKKICHV